MQGLYLCCCLLSNVTQASEPWPAMGRCVTEFGAVADGQTDNTGTFQQALDTAGRAGGGIVHVPAGQFFFAGHLSVPPGVTLSGTWVAVNSDTGERWKGKGGPSYGTILLVTEHQGNEAGDPFIFLTDQATLRGVTLYYPEQCFDAQPHSYPWAIRMRGNNCAVLDVELLNPYKGIEAVNSHRHLIRNVHGQPLRLGILVDQIYDIGRLENVHWNPWWSFQSPVFEWQQEHGEAFVFGRTDWQYVLNTFCFGYAVGYRFDDLGHGLCNGNFLGIGADDCLVPLLVERCAAYGLLITNGEFVSFHGEDPTMVVVKDTNEGSIRMTNCAFWGPCEQIARIAGKGTVGFSDCTFVQWDRHKKGTFAIQAQGGNLFVRGCEFRMDGAQIHLGEQVSKAIVSENLMRGEVRIENLSKGKVHLNANLGDQ